MKHLILGMVSAYALATPVLADPIHGIWQTAPDDNGNFGHIQMADCGAKICGTLIRSFDSSGQEVDGEDNGRNIVWDMESNGGGSYSGGKIWAPDRDRTYNSKLELSGNALKVSGCVLGICRDGGTWTRVD